MRTCSREQSAGELGRERARGTTKHRPLRLDRGEGRGEESRFEVRHSSFALRPSLHSQSAFRSSPSSPLAIRHSAEVPAEVPDHSSVHSSHENEPNYGLTPRLDGALFPFFCGFLPAAGRPAAVTDVPLPHHQKKPKNQLTPGPAEQKITANEPGAKTILREPRSVKNQMPINHAGGTKKLRLDKDFRRLHVILISRGQQRYNAH